MTNCTVGITGLEGEQMKNVSVVYVCVRVYEYACVLQDCIQSFSFLDVEGSLNAKGLPRPVNYLSRLHITSLVSANASFLSRINRH